jgi:hypothetical protein
VGRWIQFALVLMGLGGHPQSVSKPRGATVTAGRRRR